MLNTGDPPALGFSQHSRAQPGVGCWLSLSWRKPSFQMGPGQAFSAKPVLLWGAIKTGFLKEESSLDPLRLGSQQTKVNEALDVGVGFWACSRYNGETPRALGQVRLDLGKHQIWGSTFGRGAERSVEDTLLRRPGLWVAALPFSLPGTCLTT